MRWVVDPGPAIDSHVAAVADELAARGGAEGIALTHSHSDHSEAIPALQERLGGVPLGSFDTLADGDTFGPVRRAPHPRPRRRPSRVRRGPPRLHRRHRARAGQRVRVRPPARVPRRAAAAARAGPRAHLPRPRRRGDRPGGEARRVPGPPRRARATAAGGAGGGRARARTSCSTRPGPTRPRPSARSPRSRCARTWRSCARRTGFRRAERSPALTPARRSRPSSSAAVSGVLFEAAAESKIVRSVSPTWRTLTSARRGS